MKLYIQKDGASSVLVIRLKAEDMPAGLILPGTDLDAVMVMQSEPGGFCVESMHKQTWGKLVSKQGHGKAKRVRAPRAPAEPKPGPLDSFGPPPEAVPPKPAAPATSEAPKEPAGLECKDLEDRWCKDCQGRVKGRVSKAKPKGFWKCPGCGNFINEPVLPPTGQ